MAPKTYRVALDAGHGATGDCPYSGATGNGLIEDNWALAFVERLGHYLRAGGIETVLTRTDARIVDLKQRAQIAKRAKCDLLVSIHLNASSPSAHGCEAYIVPGDKRSQAIAAQAVSVVWTAGIMSRGVKRDDQSQHSSLTVLRESYKAMPAFLLEVGFLTNAGDAKLLSDRRWMDNLACKMAESISQAI